MGGLGSATGGKLERGESARPPGEERSVLLHITDSRTTMASSSGGQAPPVHLVSPSFLLILHLLLPSHLLLLAGAGDGAGSLGWMGKGSLCWERVAWTG